jgi:hypothetical protein
MSDFAPQPAPAAPQSPMVMGQPTGDMMAFRPMPVQQPGNMQGFDYRPLPPMPAGNFFPQGPTQGVAQGLGAALRDPGFQITPEQEQAMRDRYTQMRGQPMPSLQMPMQQPMQQEPGYYGSVRNMMNTGRMDANHPMAQTVGAYDRQKAMQMFGQKQAQNAMNPGFNAGLANALFY